MPDALRPPTHPVRFVTAASLFDGHDASINIMRRILQSRGVEVIHLGHNRSVDEVVDAAVAEDVQGVAISSYQGGHMEYFRYLIDRLRSDGAGHVRVYGGGGGVIVADEIAKARPDVVGITATTPLANQMRDISFLVKDRFPDVVLDIRDDLHPQVYQAAFWLGDQAKPEATPFIEDHISVVDLPVGSWAFHVELTDEAGNATRLDFEIEVGEDPPPEPHEGGCRVSGVPRGGVSGLLALVWLLLPALARRRGPR